MRGWWAGLVLACLAPCGALGHAPGSSPVHPVLGKLPGAASGMTVEVAETLAPQLLVANHTAATLEVLDPQGRAFLRIGPAGVEADLAAAAWYETLATIRPPVPELARDPRAPPHWVRVKTAPEWGWFDPRLSTAHAVPDPAVLAARQPATIGHWSIPIRIGGTPAQVEGEFRFLPPPRGAYLARLDRPSGWPMEVGLVVSQGATPAILLSNGGTETVTVLGLEGEKVLRIGPGGTSVNTGSPTWRRFGREDRATAETPGEHWLTVSRAPAYTWLEPRAATDPDAPEHRPHDWTIPVLVGARAFTLHGTSTWRDAAADE